MQKVYTPKLKRKPKVNDLHWPHEVARAGDYFCPGDFEYRTPEKTWVNDLPGPEQAKKKG